MYRCICMFVCVTKWLESRELAYLLTYLQGFFIDKVKSSVIYSTMLHMISYTHHVIYKRIEFFQLCYQNVYHH